IRVLDVKIINLLPVIGRTALIGAYEQEQAGQALFVPGAADEFLDITQPEAAVLPGDGPLVGDSDAEELITLGVLAGPGFEEPGEISCFFGVDRAAQVSPERFQRRHSRINASRPKPPRRRPSKRLNNCSYCDGMALSALIFSSYS